MFSNKQFDFDRSWRRQVHSIIRSVYLKAFLEVNWISKLFGFFWLHLITHISEVFRHLKIYQHTCQYFGRTDFRVSFQNGSQEVGLRENSSERSLSSQASQQYLFIEYYISGRILICHQLLSKMSNGLSPLFGPGTKFTLWIDLNYRHSNGIWVTKSIYCKYF